VPSRDRLDCVDVGEVDDLGLVGDAEPHGVRIPVDRDDPQSAFARLEDRAALVATRADEEHAQHGAMLDARCDRACGAVERLALSRHASVTHTRALSS
jgi:hypothetical protein